LGLASPGRENREHQSTVGSVVDGQNPSSEEREAAYFCFLLRSSGKGKHLRFFSQYGTLLLTEIYESAKYRGKKDAK
jgi:hypothetical protein